VEVFKGFYETKTKHRKLIWIYSLGIYNIIGKFEPKTIELIVSAYQVIPFLRPILFYHAVMLIIVRLKYSKILFYRLMPLLLFNTAVKLSYSEKSL